MSSQALYGSFPPQFPGVNTGFGICTLILADSQIAGNPQQTRRSLGCIRVVEIQDKPTLLETWQIIGWNLNIRLALTVGTLPVWGRIGDLWAGLLINTPFNDVGLTEFAGAWNAQVVQTPSVTKSPVQLPANLSTFTKIWDGEADPIRILAGNNFQPQESECDLIATSFSLPLPISLRNADRIQFALIKMPSVFGGAVDTTVGPSQNASNELQFAVKSAAFSVQYDDGR